jgi:hypothetical protein
VKQRFEDRPEWLSKDREIEPAVPRTNGEILSLAATHGQFPLPEENVKDRQYLRNATNKQWEICETDGIRVSRTRKKPTVEVLQRLGGLLRGLKGGSTRLTR